MPPEPPKTGNMRGIDVGGKHLAVTVDFKEESVVYDMPHKGILREIDALKSMRDRYTKGKHVVTTKRTSTVPCARIVWVSSSIKYAKRVRREVLSWKMFHQNIQARRATYAVTSIRSHV